MKENIEFYNEFFDNPHYIEKIGIVNIETKHSLLKTEIVKISRFNLSQAI